MLRLTFSPNRSLAATWPPASPSTSNEPCSSIRTTSSVPSFASCGGNLDEELEDSAAGKFIGMIMVHCKRSRVQRRCVRLSDLKLLGVDARDATRSLVSSGQVKARHPAQICGSADNLAMSRSRLRT